VADKDREKLVEAVVDYLKWIGSGENDGGNNIRMRYSPVLMEFVIYTSDKMIGWEDMFTFATLRDFSQYIGLKRISCVIMAFSDYLLTQGKIHEPVRIPKSTAQTLPDLYEQYLLYHKQSVQVCDTHLRNIRKMLLRFHDYLHQHHIELSALGIEHLDAFMATFKVSPSTLKTYRHYLRGFLKYLYQERAILKKDLASLLVGPPLFDQRKPPKFLRAAELNTLFESLKLSTPIDIRNYAIVHLVYTLGLRPIEVSRVTLDDLSFRKREIALPQRKPDHPITLPVPENTLKAIAAYVLKARPKKSPHRHLFLYHTFPYKPMRSYYMAICLSNIMKKAGLSSTGYWLRHTYAQNLLQMGRSIYEIKEMLGHQSIQASQSYLHIHTELMRKVLFNEEL
jgi:site-specific recombinase XerD